VKDLSGRQTFDHLDNFGWTIARDGLHQKMDMIFVDANLVSVQLMKAEVTLRLATSGRFREAETERVHHATRLHVQP
jgi:hypothetical protein